MSSSPMPRSSSMQRRAPQSTPRSPEEDVGIRKKGATVAWDKATATSASVRQARQASKAKGTQQTIGLSHSSGAQNAKRGALRGAKRGSLCATALAT